MKKVLICLGFLTLAGCATQTEWVTFPSGQGGRGVTLQVWLEKHPMLEGQEVRIDPISASDSSSSHIVQIRKQEILHTHEQHDLVVILLRGNGQLILGDKKLSVKPGAVVSIPKGIPHAFVNQSNQPAAAFVVFMPAFDGIDTIPVKEKK